MTTSPRNGLIDIAPTRTRLDILCSFSAQQLALVVVRTYRLVSLVQIIDETS